MSLTETPGRFGRPPKDRKAAARVLRLTEMTVIGGHLVAANPSGELYEWHGDFDRWAPLVAVVRQNNRKSGGIARAKALSADRRSEIASQAARARWQQN